MWFLPSCRRDGTRRVALSVVVSLVGWLSAVGLVGHAHADRVFGDDVLVGGEPVGSSWHRSYSSGQHGILSRGGTVFVVWSGNGPEGTGIYLSRSIDCGDSFEAPTRVNDIGIAGYYACLDGDHGSSLYVVWHDKRDGDGPHYNIYFSKSTDGGESFSPDVRVDDAGDDPSWQTNPAIAVDDSGRIHVVWLDDRGNGGSGVYFSRSLDGGATFDSSIALPNANENPPIGVWPQAGPSVAAAGDGRVYVSYVDERHVDNGYPLFVCVRHSTDGGETFSDPVDVASNLGDFTYRTSIAVSGSVEVYVSWIEDDDYPFVARSDDGGQTFGPRVQVTDRAACCGTVYRAISLSADPSGWLGVAWRDNLNIIAFCESRDRGATFLPPVLLEGPGQRDYATVALGEDHTAYVAWTDYQHSSKGDIYFSKGILDPPAGIEGDFWDEPSSRRLVSVKPNPFSSGVTVDFAYPSKLVNVGVYDLRGRLVRELIGQEGTVTWDGLDEGGSRVAPGIYFIAASGESTSQGVKVVLSR